MTDNWQSFCSQAIDSDGCTAFEGMPDLEFGQPVCGGCGEDVPIVCFSGYCVSCCEMEMCGCSVFEMMLDLE